jgi:Fe-S cluster biosynthesis and repair protein YggX
MSRHKIRIFCFMPFRVREGMDVGVRSSNDIYDPIGQVGWKHWVSRKIVEERWSPYSCFTF